ncbi:uncharacterized protein LOC142629054 [Castanea sativa]|uniref:uncharacterized protein LOC142629054 n=1 Tax=Castanea sativa TaxID=21020 RepID=UPI003F650CA1
MRQLMRHIEKYKRLEDDWQQNKGKASVISQPKQAGFQSRLWRDLRIQEPNIQAGEVNVTFKEPVHRIVEWIKGEPYFRWPNKMGGDPMRRNQNLYCNYHRDKGHTTKQCRVLKDHMEQLVRVGHLKEFIVEPRNQESGQGARPQGNPLPPPLGVIEFIHVALRGTLVTRKKGVLTVVPVESGRDEQPTEKKMKYTREPIAFDDDDLEGTTQLHDDALVVIAQINGFVVKRVMVDQGSGAEVMYPDLFRGLGLKNEDLSKYDTPLVGFDGRMVVLKGHISLPVNMEGKEVMVTFIVVNLFSSYTTILGRLWIHAMGAVPSTLHVKIKFYTDNGITTVRGSQQVARQYLVAAVN